MARSKTPTLIPYTPQTWNETQKAMHHAVTMEDAWNNAACLTAGWYRRPISIDIQVTEDNDERYMLRPSEVPVAEGWTPCYEVKRLEAVR